MGELDPKYVSWFKHEDHRQYVADRLGAEPWVTVYESLPTAEGSEGGGWFSALVPNSKVADALKDHTWDLMIGQGRPGFTVYGDGRKPPEYSHFSADEPIPLVLVRSFESHREGYCELLEEFRLFHNLYEETRTEKYFKVDDNGDEEEIARVEPNKVEAKLRAVRQFCAVKGMHLAVYFELDRYSQHCLAELGLAVGVPPSPYARPLSGNLDIPTSSSFVAVLRALSSAEDDKTLIATSIAAWPQSRRRCLAPSGTILSADSHKALQAASAST